MYITKEHKILLLVLHFADVGSWREGGGRGAIALQQEEEGKTEQAKPDQPAPGESPSQQGGEGAHQAPPHGMAVPPGGPGGPRPGMPPMGPGGPMMFPRGMMPPYVSLDGL